MLAVDFLRERLAGRCTDAAMASSPRASNQAEWQRPPQRTPHSHIAYLPSGALHFPVPTGRPTAHSGEFESGLPRSAQPPPPPPRRVLSHAQAATSLTGQAHTSLYRGVSLQPAGHQVSLGVGIVLGLDFGYLEAQRADCYLQAAGYYGAVPPSSQQQQQQWLLPVQGQNLPFGGHQAWVQTAYRQQPYSQQQPMAMPQQMAEHQPALQQPGVAPQMRTHSAPSPQYAHARPQLWQQPSVQHVSQQTASQRVFSHQKSSLNGNARPFVGSAKASALTSIAAEVHSEASGSGVSNHTSPSTSSPLPDAATGQILLPVIWLQAIVSNSLVTHASRLCNDMMFCIAVVAHFVPETTWFLTVYPIPALQIWSQCCMLCCRSPNLFDGLT